MDHFFLMNQVKHLLDPFLIEDVRLIRPSSTYLLGTSIRLTKQILTLQNPANASGYPEPYVQERALALSRFLYPYSRTLAYTRLAAIDRRFLQPRDFGLSP